MRKTRKIINNNITAEIKDKTANGIRIRVVNYCSLCKARKAEMDNCPKCDAKEYYNNSVIVISD